MLVGNSKGFVPHWAYPCCLLYVLICSSILIATCLLLAASLAAGVMRPTLANVHIACALTAQVDMRRRYCPTIVLRISGLVRLCLLVLFFIDHTPRMLSWWWAGPPAWNSPAPPSGAPPLTPSISAAGKSSSGLHPSVQHFRASEWGKAAGTGASLPLSYHFPGHNTLDFSLHSCCCHCRAHVNVQIVFWEREGLLFAT